MLPIRDINPASTTPLATVALVAICAIVFIYQLALGVSEGPFAAQAFVYRHGLIPFEIAHGVKLTPHPSRLPHPLSLFEWREEMRLQLVGEPVRGFGEAVRLLYLPIILSIFMHGSIVHLGLNMLFLWIFGNNVEDAMGHIRFLFFYLICGAAAGLIHLVTNLNSQIPTIGASGAIAGVMGAYLVLYPRARILTLVPLFFYFTFVELPAVVFLGIWFLMQLLMARSGGDVAWFAHIGGFIAGLFLVRKFVRYSPRSRGRYRGW